VTEIKCPLFFAACLSHKECVKEECAWFTKKEECAMRSVAESLDIMVDRD